jgi:hypothetical protein
MSRITIAFIVDEHVAWECTCKNDENAYNGVLEMWERLTTGEPYRIEIYSSVE